MNDIELFDYSGINSSEELQAAMGNANVVFAVNRHDQTQKGLVWGASWMRAISQGKTPFQDMKMIGFLVDFDTTELEHLHASVAVLKASYDGTFPSAE